MEIKYLSDVVFPNVKKIILVMDNLNTHKPASLYKVFTPQEARRIIKWLEIHYTPKYGSWLNNAEYQALKNLSVICQHGKNIATGIYPK